MESSYSDETMKRKRDAREDAVPDSAHGSPKCCPSGGVMAVEIHTTKLGAGLTKITFMPCSAVKHRVRLTDPINGEETMKNEHTCLPVYVSDSDHGSPKRCLCGGEIAVRIFTSGVLECKGWLPCKTCKKNGLQEQERWIDGVEDEMSKVMHRIRDD